MSRDRLTSAADDRAPAMVESRGGWRGAPAPLRTAAVIAGCLLMLAAAVAAVSLVLVKLAPLTLAMAAALLLTALLSPVHALLRRLRLASWLAALATVVVLLIAVVGPLTLITNQAMAQFADLEDQVVQGLDRIRDYLLAGPLTPAQLNGTLDGLVETLRGAAPDPVSGAATAVHTLASVGIALVLLFFLLRDGPGMSQWFLTLVPGRRRARRRCWWLWSATA